jgi:hypothetical protein
MLRVAALIISLIILTCICAHAASDLLISKNISKENAEPIFAVDTKSGNILVVWTQYGSDTRVYCALLKRGGAGNYSLGATKRLSAKRGFNARPFPLYVPDKNHFLVAWDQADPDNPLDITSIVGRIVSTSGNPVGKEFTILSTPNRLSNVRLFYRNFGAAAPAMNMPQQQINIAVRFHGIRDNAAQQIGINFGLLDGNYQSYPPRTLIQNTRQIVGGEEILLNTAPSGTVAADNQNAYLPVVNETIYDKSGTDTRPESSLIVINRFDFIADVKKIGVPINERTNVATTVLVKDGSTLVIGSFVENGTARNVAHEMPLVGNVPLLKHLFSQDTMDKARENLIVFITAKVVNLESAFPAKKKTIGYQLIADKDGVVYRKKLVEGGKTKGKAKKVIDTDNTLKSMFAGEILIRDEQGQPVEGKKAEFYLVWQKKIDRSNHEIHGYHLKLKR